MPTHTTMRYKKIDRNSFWSSFLVVWGFDNDLNEKAEEIIETSIQDKIRSDLKKVNQDYRSSYSKILNNAIALDD